MNPREKILRSYLRRGWKLIPLVPNTKKPAISNPLEQASNELKVVMEWERKHKGPGYGLALSNSGLVAIDVDPRNGGLETWDALTAKHGLPITLKNKTSQGGLHFVFSCSKELKFLKELGPGIDIKHKGYIAIDPTVHPSGWKYTWEDAEASVTELPTWIRKLGGKENSRQSVSVKNGQGASLLEEIAQMLQNVDLSYEQWVQVGMAFHHADPSDEGLEAYKQASQGLAFNHGDDELAEDKWRSFGKSGGNPSTLLSVLKILRDEGQKVSHLRAKLDFGELPENFQSVEGACLENGTWYFSEKSKLVKHLNSQGFFCLADSDGPAFSQLLDPTSSRPRVVMLPSGKFKELVAPYKLRTLEEGKTKVKDGHLVWSDSIERQSYRRVRFCPHECPGDLNLWRDLEIKPVDKDCIELLSLIKKSICNGNSDNYNFLLGWLAHTIQKPQTKVATVPVLSGIQGTGKGFLVDKIIRKILGQSFYKVVDCRSLTNRFNSDLAHRRLIFVDEASSKNSAAAMNVLKGLTGAQTMSVEYKFGGKYEIEDYSRFIIATNDPYAIPLERGNRRFAFIEGSEEHANDYKLFARLHQSLDEDLAERFYSFLLKMDLSNFNPEKIPSGIGLGIQSKLKTFGPVAMFWHDLFYENPSTIHAGEQGISRSVCFDLFKIFSGHKIEFMSAQEFWSKSKELMPTLRKAKRTDSKACGVRSRFLHVTPEVMAKELAKTLGLDFPEVFNPEDYEMNESETTDASW